MMELTVLGVSAPITYSLKFSLQISIIKKSGWVVEKKLEIRLKMENTVPSESMHTEYFLSSMKYVIALQSKFKITLISIYR